MINTENSLKKKNIEKANTDETDIGRYLKKTDKH